MSPVTVRRAILWTIVGLLVLGLLLSTSWTLALCRSCSTIGSVVDCYNTVVTTLSGGYC